MVETMRAQRFYAETKSIALEDVPIPDPGPGEVLVKVAFCGICHSDLSLINGRSRHSDPSSPRATRRREPSQSLGRASPVGRRAIAWWSPQAAMSSVRQLRARRFGELPPDSADGFRLYDGAWANTPSPWPPDSPVPDDAAGTGCNSR